SQAGQGSYVIDRVWPSRCHSSSPRCGANGDRILTNISNQSRGTAVALVASLTNTIMSAIAVLNRRSVIDCVTFLIAACSARSSSRLSVGASSLTLPVSPSVSGSTSTRHARSRNRRVPDTPEVSHSTPSSGAMSSGLTTLYRLLDILSSLTSTGSPVPLTCQLVALIRAKLSLFGS